MSTAKPATQRHCMALDLHDEPELIQEYCDYHAEGKAWPEITDSIKQAGIVDMEIYLIGNRLFMIMDVEEGFDFDKKAQMDADNDKVQTWETLMSKFQKPLKWAQEGEKWLQMQRIYKLPE